MYTGQYNILCMYVCMLLMVVSSCDGNIIKNLLTYLLTYNTPLALLADASSSVVPVWHYLSQDQLNHNQPYRRHSKP